MVKVAPSVEKIKAKANNRARRKGDLAPNPELWQALDNGELMLKVLEDFYTQVYADPRLSPFFEHATKQRAIEKQFSFMKRIFTGEDCYFGERPRNAHHWMVISDELFDYREELMENTLRKHGLAENFIKQWRAAEEVFRKQIVKDKAFGKKIGGIEIPADGYEVDTLTVGSMCDNCMKELSPGDQVTYHVRTGKVFCGECTPES